MFVGSPVSLGPLCSPLSVHDVDIWGSQVVGIRKLVCRFKVGVPALCLSCRRCLSWHNTLFTNFHTVRCLVLCDFQKSGMRIRPCLRFLTAVELLIKRLMIKLSKRDSWAELLPMSDRGHALPSQPRVLPPAESRPCLDTVPRLGRRCTRRLLPFPCISRILSSPQVQAALRTDRHCDPPSAE